MAKIFIPYIKRNSPYVFIEILDLKQKPIKVNCLIDTGFSVGLSLPEKLETKVKKKFALNSYFELANGQTIKEAVYFTRLKLPNQQNVALTTVFSKADEGLVGMEFLYYFNLWLSSRAKKVYLDPVE